MSHLFMNAMLHENNSENHELEREVNGAVTDKIASDRKGYQMPAHLVASEFGEVNVFRGQTTAHPEVVECRVNLTIAMEPQGRFAEGWRTGLALDASASMKRAYGRKVEARVDPALLTDYIKQGRLRSYMEDGEPTRKIQREAFAEIQERGYEINYTENILQPLVQNFTAYLAGSLDGTGKTSLIYWGCGKGDEIQVLGEFNAVGCQELAIAGPASFKLGKTTKLLPAIAYFVEKYRQAPRGIYIFLTDGRIDDLEQVKIYTKDLALEIAVGKRNYLKLILIGIGNDVDRFQLQELDDFDTGLDIDLWDYKIASEMCSLTQIFAEVVNDNQIIAESGSIYDDAGNCVKSYANGLPSKIDFMMRDDSQWFELEVNNQRIRQSVIFSDIAIAPLPKKNLFDFEINAKEIRNADLRASLIEEDQNTKLPLTLQPWWKQLAALLIGTAFIGTMLAFAILIKQSDDNKSQDLITESKKEAMLKSQATTSQATSNQKSNNQSNNQINPNNLNKSNKNTDNIANIPNNSSSNKSITTSNQESELSSKTSNKNPKESKTLSDPINSKDNSSILTLNNAIQKDNANASANNGINGFVELAGDITEKNSLNNLWKISIATSDSNSLNNSPKELNTGSNNTKQTSDNATKNNTGNLVNESSKSSNSNNINNPNSGISSKNSDRLSDQNNRNNRNISASILPIANPDLEVTIFFPSDEAQLVPPEETKIDNFWSKIQGRRGIIQVSGHTDRTGDYAYNLDLSQARANEVVRLLRDRGLDNNYKITFQALSWLQPLRKNSTATDYAFNRRVVLQFKEQR